MEEGSGPFAEDRETRVVPVYNMTESFLPLDENPYTPGGTALRVTAPGGHSAWITAESLHRGAAGCRAESAATKRARPSRSKTIR